ncbi:hypothetical protein ACGFZA_31835 [Streptomyces sp. NPDC048211]|uniref:hypothetical protein n=1 Tax=Streptomyces sp. NPDC048211 TaxID=3365516 RepID=UPI003716E123
MTLHIVVNCDRSVPYGTCAARLYTGTSTEDEALAVAERASWDINGGGRDYCPAHSPRTRPPTPPTPLRPHPGATHDTH